MNVLKKTMKLWEAYTAPKKRIDTPQNVAGSKVYMPDYGRCEYNCLEELILDLRHNSGSCERYNLFLDHIVQYNIRFRDSLRAMGIEGVIETLIAECPSLTNEEKELNKLRSWWKERMHEHIADYDIQCYPRDAILYLCGCPFNGLSDIGSQIEMSASGKYRWNEDRVYLRKDFKPNTFGLHVGELWESYPTFDSYDASDGRSYDNFIIRKRPISTSDLKLLYEVKCGMNACRVHEEIPVNLLPVVYHDGDNGYILVATNKIN